MIKESNATMDNEVKKLSWATKKKGVGPALGSATAGPHVSFRLQIGWYPQTVMPAGSCLSLDPPGKPLKRLHLFDQVREPLNSPQRNVPSESSFSVAVGSKLRHAAAPALLLPMAPCPPMGAEVPGGRGDFHQSVWWDWRCLTLSLVT